MVGTETRPPPRIGVVIPTLDEAEHLPWLLDDLSRLSFPATVVVANGGSVDGTIAAARAAGATIAVGERGRAHQMNTGAALVTTPWLLFLHADVRLSHDALDAVERHVGEASDLAAHFRFSVDQDPDQHASLPGGRTDRPRRAKRLDERAVPHGGRSKRPRPVLPSAPRAVRAGRGPGPPSPPGVRKGAAPRAGQDPPGGRGGPRGSRAPVPPHGAEGGGRGAPRPRAGRALLRS